MDQVVEIAADALFSCARSVGHLLRRQFVIPLEGTCDGLLTGHDRQFRRPPMSDCIIDVVDCSLFSVFIFSLVVKLISCFGVRDRVEKYGETVTYWLQKFSVRLLSSWLWYWMSSRRSSSARLFSLISYRDHCSCARLLFVIKRRTLRRCAYPAISINQRRLGSSTFPPAASQQPKNEEKILSLYCK